MTKTTSHKNVTSTTDATKNGSEKPDADEQITLRMEAAKRDVPKAGDDSQHGQGLLAKVEARRAELVQALKVARAAQGRDSEGNRAQEIEKALGAVGTLLTGDLKNISGANGIVLNEWIETSAVLVTAKPAKKVAAPSPEASPKHEPAAKSAQ